LFGYNILIITTHKKL